MKFEISRKIFSGYANNNDNQANTGNGNKSELSVKKEKKPPFVTVMEATGCRKQLPCKREANF